MFSKKILLKFLILFSCYYVFIYLFIASIMTFNASGELAHLYIFLSCTSPGLRHQLFAQQCAFIHTLESLFPAHLRIIQYYLIFLNKKSNLCFEPGTCISVVHWQYFQWQRVAGSSLFFNNFNTVPFIAVRGALKFSCLCENPNFVIWVKFNSFFFFFSPAWQQLCCMVVLQHMLTSSERRNSTLQFGALPSKWKAQTY